MTELLNNIGDVIRNLAAFFVLSTILLRLLPGEAYARYLRFFLGLLLVVSLLKPLISALSAEDLFTDALGLSADALSLSAAAWGLSTDGSGSGADAWGLSTDDSGSGADALGRSADGSESGEAAWGRSADGSGTGADASDLDADSFAEQLESSVAAVSADGWGTVLAAYQGDIQEQVNAQIADLGVSVAEISLDDDGESLIFVIEKAENQTDGSMGVNEENDAETESISIGSVKIEIPVISVFLDAGEEADVEKEGEEMSSDEVTALVRTRIAGYCGISEDAVEVVVADGW